MRSRYLGITLSLVLNVCSWGLPLVAHAQDGDSSVQKHSRAVDISNIANPQVKIRVPRQGLPGRREAGTTRRMGGACTFGNKRMMVLLLPTTNVGLTTSAYPQFFWYTPENKAQNLKFSLYQVEQKTKKQTLLYQENIQPQKTAGITSFTLPNDGKLAPLQVNHTYQWSVTMVCNALDNSPKSNINVYGWVQRIAADKKVESKIQGMTQRDRLTHFGDRGLWFDYLSTLADLRSCNPTDSKVKQIWVETLQTIDLKHIAEQPLQQKCVAR
ncbi:DUF928 domain-containing protein [Calothrix sp. 336/3]|uniref:DUF928 domain-containing protein n=1 Tax=Calothrix sp. 336/3 TaxID=1337936 RepID=UPI0004E30CD1|nr:DUF928 domain-containing protein [Calothrix sp. 336/3]AKG24251.1 hypothetical protein IJ00_25660 [Calothrix sp. 336/3]